MMQHYVWYADRNAALALEQQELTPLLPTTGKSKAAPHAVHAHKRPAGWVTLHGHHGLDEHAVERVVWDATAEAVRV